MSGEDDLFLNQSEAEALFFSDALLDNADELDFESFGDTSGLDDGTFDSITGPDLISLGNGDIFKSAGLSNGDSFGNHEVDGKRDPSSMISQEVSVPGGAVYSNGSLHRNYMFCKPTLDLENMGMAYSSGLYLQGNGGATGLGSPSSPCMNQSGLLSPSMAASEKLNGLTLGQMAPSYGPPFNDTKANLSLGFSQGLSFCSAGLMAVNCGTKQFATSPLTSPVTQASAQQPAANGMSRFGTQDMVITAAASNGLPQGSTLKDSTSPALSPDSADGKESIDGLLGGENTLKMSQRKQYFGMNEQGGGVLHREGGADTASFVDQVDGDGDGLQPLPQMTRSSMQRSYSSHALGQLRHLAPAPPLKENTHNSRHSQMELTGNLTSPGTRMQPQPSEFQSMGIRPLMRRVHSAGDIQTLNGMQVGLGGSASPNFEEGSYRIGKYSMEERKLRIHRYQQKRTQRNFNKKIKYACRKTLADSRPRVRGRFAKNMDDDVPATIHGRKREDEDDDEGEPNLGEEDDAFHFEDSSGDLSDMLGTTIKLEHRSFKSM